MQCKFQVLCKMKTKCSEIFTQNGKPNLHLNLKDNVFKKPSGKKSPITPCTVLLYRQNTFKQEDKKNEHNSIKLENTKNRHTTVTQEDKKKGKHTSVTLEDNKNRHTSVTLEAKKDGRIPGRTSEQCVNFVSNWLRSFQQNVSIGSGEEPMEENSPDPASQEPSTSSGSPQGVDNAPQLHQQVDNVGSIQGDVSASATASSAGMVSLEHYSREAASTSAGVGSPIDYQGGPPSVGSSVLSAPSPASSGGEMSYSQGGASSSASQDEQPDSTSKPGKPARTPERREKQRIASMKSRKKKGAEHVGLVQQEKDLKEDNARLEKQIEYLEIERKRYLSGEFEVDWDAQVHDPLYDDESDDEAGASASATS
ncbi:uncharacterized protein [Amphiura filiformis]|uniref:uncharacterized protein isoform X2 n=1 Tax=Amphiura filiformis TaxID=82378 RepID=UPI003B215865